MTLSEHINHDLIEAIKTSQNSIRDTLRLVKTSIKNREIRLGHTLTDEEIIEVLNREAKQRLEAAQSFRDGNRALLATKEEAELVILKKYLPPALSETEINELIRTAIDETGATAINDIGKVMAMLIPKIRGRSDGTIVSQLVRQHLT